MIRSHKIILAGIIGGIAVVAIMRGTFALSGIEFYDIRDAMHFGLGFAFCAVVMAFFTRAT